MYKTKMLEWLYNTFGAMAREEFEKQQEAYKAGRPYKRTWLTVLETFARRGYYTMSDVLDSIYNGEADESALRFLEAISEATDAVYEMSRRELTATEAERDYGLPKGTIRRDINRGRFRDDECVKVGHNWMVSRAAVERLYGTPRLD